MKRERAALSPSGIIERYVALVKSLPPKKRPTFEVGLDLQPVDAGLDADGKSYIKYLAIGNLDRVIRKVSKLSGADTVEVFTAIMGWKGTAAKLKSLRARTRALDDAVQEG